MLSSLFLFIYSCILHILLVTLTLTYFIYSYILHMLLHASYTLTHFIYSYLFHHPYLFHYLFHYYLFHYYLFHYYLFHYLLHHFYLLHYSRSTLLLYFIALISSFSFISLPKLSHYSHYFYLPHSPYLFHSYLFHYLTSPHPFSPLGGWRVGVCMPGGGYASGCACTGVRVPGAGAVGVCILGCVCRGGSRAPPELPPCLSPQRGGGAER